MRIPANIRIRRLIVDLKRKIPFFKPIMLTNEGEALVIHLRNLYRGDAPYSNHARDYVNGIMKQTKTDEKTAVEAIFLNFYAMGLIDEIALVELKM